MLTSLRARRAARGPLVVGLLLAGLVLSPVGPGATPRAQAADLGAGGEYHPLAPARIFSSRDGINDTAPAGKKPLTVGSGSTFEVQLLGRGGVPSSAANVLAVVVNVTAVDVTQPGYLSIYGKGASAGPSSLINFNAGQNVPNTAIVRPGTGGRAVVRLTSQAANGRAHVLVDIVGWFSTSTYTTRGARLIPAGPGRIYDTRSMEAGGTPMGAGDVRTINIRGADSSSPKVTDMIPTGPSIVGAVLNVTGVNIQANSVNTFVSVVPDAIAPGTTPTTSNLNLPAGVIKANLVIVPVGADGKVRIFNERGSTHVIVDVMGYLQTGMAATTRAGRVIPLDAPFRVFDTRQTAFNATPLIAGSSEDWSFLAFANSVRSGDEAVGKQSALLGNLTAASVSRIFPGIPASTYMTVYPPPNRPGTSNLNATENTTVPNMAFVRYGTAGADPYVVRVYNFDGYVHYILDVAAVVLGDV